MANGQAKAEQNVKSFLSWSASMKDDDFVQIIFRGNLSRAEIAKGVGCARSALTQNPRVKAMLTELEDDLRKRGVLPQLTDKASSVQTQPKAYDRTLLKRSQDSNPSCSSASAVGCELSHLAHLKPIFILLSFINTFVI